MTTGWPAPVLRTTNTHRGPLPLFKGGLTLPKLLNYPQYLGKELTLFGAKQMREKALNSYGLGEHQLIEQERHQPRGYELLRQAADSVQQEPGGRGALGAWLHATAGAQPGEASETQPRSGQAAPRT